MVHLIARRECLECLPKLAKNFLHVHGVQIHRVIELTTVHAHSIASQVNAASCAKIKTDV